MTITSKFVPFLSVLALFDYPNKSNKCMTLQKGKEYILDKKKITKMQVKW